MKLDALKRFGCWETDIARCTDKRCSNSTMDFWRSISDAPWWGFCNDSKFHVLHYISHVPFKVLILRGRFWAHFRVILVNFGQYGTLVVDWCGRRFVLELPPRFSISLERLNGIPSHKVSITIHRCNKKSNYSGWWVWLSDFCTSVISFTSKRLPTHTMRQYLLSLISNH